MADQRLASPTALRVIHTELSVFNMMGTGAVNSAVSSTWPATSKCLFIPVPCPGPFTVKQFAYLNGAAISGNLDLGLYTPEGQKIISTGSTAQAGSTATWQTIDVTDTEIPPGWYYLAMVADNTTAQINRLGTTNILKRLYGCMEQTSTFPLPSSATLAVCTSDGFFPNCQAMGVTTI